MEGCSLGKEKMPEQETYLILGFCYWTYACALPLLNFLVEVNYCWFKEGGIIFT